ncbi:hypothetical protein Tco_0024019 [Tanacetum coccineum]
MEDPYITMEEYIQLEAEKAHRRGQTFNWETATYDKVRYFEDIDYFKDFETEFPAIVYKDALTSKPEVLPKPTVSPHYDKKVDFEISFAESDDEDYTFTYDKNSFYYKLISVNDLKPDSRNDNDKIYAELSSEDIHIQPLDSVIDANIDTHSHEFDENFETSHGIPAYPADWLSSVSEQSEGEAAEKMEPTMEEYMCKTQEDYGGSNNEDANEHIEKVLEIIDLFHIHEITQDQIMLLAFHMSLTGATSRWLRSEPSGSIITWEQILDSKGAIPTMKAADAKKSIQEMADHSQKSHNGTSTRARSTETSDGLAIIQAQLNNLGREIKKVNEKVYAAQVRCESCGGRYRAAALEFYQRDSGNPSYQERRQTMEESQSKFMAESAKRHDENSNLIKEIRSTTDGAIRNQGSSIKTLEIKIRQMSKVLQEKGFGNLPGSTETKPRDHVKSISTTVEADTPSICRINPSRYAMDVLDSATYLKKMLRERPKTGYQIEASTNKNNLVVLEDPLPPNEKDPGSFTLPCYIRALANLGDSVGVMPMTSFTNLGLGELAPTKLTVELADKTIKHPKGIAENILVGIEILLKEPMDEALILNRSLELEFGDFIEANDLNEPLELRRNQVNDLGPTREEGEIIDEPMKNIVKTRIDNEKIEGINEYLSIYDHDRKIHVDCAYNLQFSCMIGFTYMFTVIRRWEMSLLENHFVELHVSKQGDSKDLLPFTMVSARDKLNGISHPYQLLKSFYKGILNLGPEYVRDKKMEEWLTRGYVSMYEME